MRGAANVNAVLTTILFLSVALHAFHYPNVLSRSGVSRFVPFKNGAGCRNQWHFMTKTITTSVNNEWMNTFLDRENNTRSLFNIIEFGNSWIHSLPENDFNMLELTEAKGYYQVPGCLANVKLKVSIDSNQVPSKVRITGSADSQVALGMLAIVSKVG